ncbi:exopolysaccharide biosynthesis protein, partial [Clostridium estertheticum]|nr:exopolysaccharide biosynthesis protein [Clostridium estertheticum]
MGSKNISQRKRKKNYKLRNFMFYLVFISVFTGVSAPLIIFHGPFTNVKKTIVDAAMTTLSHQWIAKLFLSDAEIQKIRDEDTVQVMQQGNNIKFSNSHDNSIERYNISSGIKFKGYLLIIKDPARVKV